LGWVWVAWNGVFAGSGHIGLGVLKEGIFRGFLVAAVFRGSVFKDKFDLGSIYEKSFPGLLIR
jgi:hypothetical protein